MSSIDVLLEYGFTERERTIYLACLQIGSSPLTKIARIANEKRSTTHSVLQSLQQKGCIIERREGNTSYFSANNPDYLLQKEKEKLSRLEESLPVLHALIQTSKDKPILTFYEGEGQVRKQYLDLLNAGNGGISSFISFENVSKEFRDMILNEIMPQRAAKGILIRVLMKGTPDDLDYINADEAKYSKEIRIIKHPLFSLESQIHMYAGDTISIIFASHEELSGIIIRSPKLFRTVYSFFEILRESSK